jgi:hypothetical protein
VDEVLGHVLPLGVMRECAKGFAERPYGRLSLALMEKFIFEFAPEDIFAALRDVLAALLRKVPAEMWERGVYVISGVGERERPEEVCLAEVNEIGFMLDLMEDCVACMEGDAAMEGECSAKGDTNAAKNGSEEFFLQYAALCIHLGQLQGRACVRLTVKQMARAVALGLVKPDLLYQYLCAKGLTEVQDAWRAQRGEAAQENQEAREIQVVQIVQETQEIRGIQEMQEIQEDRKCQSVQGPVRAPAEALLEQAVKRLSARVIEIELGRGDSATPVSRLAMDIVYHEGAAAFVGILAALAGEALDNGDDDGARDGEGDVCWAQLTKSVVLSSLLRASAPGPEDNADGLRQVLRAESYRLDAVSGANGVVS